MSNLRKALFLSQVRDVSIEERKKSLLEAASHNSLPASVNSSAADAIKRIKHYIVNQRNQRPSLPSSFLPPVRTTGLQSQGLWGKHTLANKAAGLLSRAANAIINTTTRSSRRK